MLNDIYIHSLYSFKVYIFKLSLLRGQTQHRSVSGSETVHRHVFCRQFTDKIGDSSPTYLKTVHRQNNVWEYLNKERMIDI